MNDFPVPSSKKQLMRFLVMTGYYRKFCNKFASMSAPLTVFFFKKQNVSLFGMKLVKILLGKSRLCLDMFFHLASNFCKQFKLAVDLVMLMQGGRAFHKKMEMVLILLFVIFQIDLTNTRNTKTEKEGLALILSFH